MTFETIQELEKELAVVYRKASNYHRLYQKANGKFLRRERTRDGLLKDKIFLKRKIWAILDVLPDDANWHNAPDYIRHFKSQMSAHAKQSNHYQMLYNDLKKRYERLKVCANCNHSGQPYYDAYMAPHCDKGTNKCSRWNETEETPDLWEERN